MPTIEEVVNADLRKKMDAAAEKLRPGALPQIDAEEAKAASQARAKREALNAVVYAWEKLVEKYDDVRKRLTRAAGDIGSIDAETTALEFARANFGNDNQSIWRMVEMFKIVAGVRELQRFYKETWLPETERELETAGREVLEFAKEHSVPAECVPASLRQAANE